MSFEDQIRNFVERAKMIKDNILTEEATKTSLIMPFFQILGYDVFNPSEFTPEYIADVGIKKGEKVDYAILSSDGDPVILIEAKSVTEQLTKHDSQLFRYFGTSKAKFAILTNGIIYRFYTDLEEKNKMDENPFLEVNMLELKDIQLPELKKFHKENFSVENIMDTASELKYMGLIRGVLREIFTNPSDDFIRFILGCGVYDGVKTQNVLDRYAPIVKKSITTYINELVNERIQSALNKEDVKGSVVEVEADPEDEIEEVASNNAVITTEEELEAFYIVKAILRNSVDSTRISYKDTQTYFSVNIDGKVTRWVCRIYLKENIKYIVIPNSEKDAMRYDLNSVDDIYSLSSHLIERARNFG